MVIRMPQRNPMISESVILLTRYLLKMLLLSITISLTTGIWLVGMRE